MMKRRVALLSIAFGGESGLAIIRDSSGLYSVGNLPSSPVSNMWSLTKKYTDEQAAIRAAERLAKDAGRRLMPLVEKRPGVLVMEFKAD